MLAFFRCGNPAPDAEGRQLTEQSRAAAGLWLDVTISPLMVSEPTGGPAQVITKSCSKKM
ncbi:MAG: hypothetical protein EOR84_08940 [Mesorhizobium sp.]|uniref:hypothetical protein n=1 Tax=Mesorhizobium sp. TaxID=1871066 RepID=UPI000FE8F259|nr:hypothetical protein [Mesorhizobium sp.]RWN00082.1 MAG: hypothetical protein EOR84_08940 [Mesorhizobium sp.]